MTVELFVFVVAAAACLAGAIGVVASRNPVHAALSLVGTLFGIAVLFVAEEANFLAAVQVIVYAGAIVVLFLFVIMLLGVDKADDLSIEPFPIQRPLAAVVGVGLAGLVIAAIVRARDRIVEGTPLEPFFPWSHSGMPAWMLVVGGTMAATLITAPLSGMIALPKAMMRVGWMRTMVSSKFWPKALPPSGSTSAVPRISIMRGCQGGSTSSTTMAAFPARPTSRTFLVWLIRRPPTSMASASAL